jgi:methionyl-tRNA formyltransferase
LKTVFLASGEFSRDLLRDLLRSDFEISALVTRPDRPAGRSLKPNPTPAGSLAVEEGMKIYMPASPADPGFMSVLEELQPELLLVADYGFMLPVEVLMFPPGGCVNVHPSLLPRYRGAAPIQRALMDGASVTGVTLMAMDEGMDTGPIIARQEVEIGDEDDAHALRSKLAALAARMVEEYVPQYLSGAIVPIPQDEGAATYAEPVAKNEYIIDWTREARDIRNQVRALSPRPGAHTNLRGKRVKIIEAGLREDIRGLKPASLEVTQKGILLVGTGRGALQPHVLQPEGKRVVSAEEFLRGYRIEPGEAFA